MFPATRTMQHVGFRLVKVGAGPYRIGEDGNKLVVTFTGACSCGYPQALAMECGPSATSQVRLADLRAAAVIGTCAAVLS